MSTTPVAPSWPYCAHGADPATDPVGCPGIHVPGRTACLAHLSDADRGAYMAGLTPGAEVDHRGTTFTASLLTALLNALRDPSTGNARLGLAWFDSAIFEGDADFGSVSFEDDARFMSAVFKSRAEFDSAIFKSHAGFMSATFEGAAKFMLATFEGFGRFRSAVFKSRAEFGLAIFKDAAGFESATFESRAE
ncbi:pentapeptide repeat-containing protein, partial [Streptomyces rubrogriseus]|uniref:pentapeptide repeat-containing protein n=1 Tax=Streptomyces rubrogriseus TaxID=194673 RepID=UPI0037D98BDD